MHHKHVLLLRPAAPLTCSSTALAATSCRFLLCCVVNRCCSLDSCLRRSSSTCMTSAIVLVTAHAVCPCDSDAERTPNTHLRVVVCFLLPKPTPCVLTKHVKDSYVVADGRLSAHATSTTAPQDTTVLLSTERTLSTHAACLQHQVHDADTVNCSWLVQAKNMLLLRTYQRISSRPSVQQQLCVGFGCCGSAVAI